MGVVLSRHRHTHQSSKYSRLPTDEQDLTEFEPPVTDCCAIPLTSLSSDTCFTSTITEIMRPTQTEIRDGTISLRDFFDKPSSSPQAVHTTPVKGSTHPSHNHCVSASNDTSEEMDSDFVMPGGKISIGGISLLSSQEHPTPTSFPREPTDCSNFCAYHVHQHNISIKARHSCLRRSRSNVW